MPPPTTASGADAPRFFAGEVMHHRLRPRANRFRYGVFFVVVPIERPSDIARPWFGVNARRVLSIRYRDYGPGADVAPRAWIRDLLAREGLALPAGEILLQTFPRVLGVLFNPVSFWHCRDAEGATRIILAEVNNTFGERHVYVLAHPDGRPIGAGETLAARKVFHVSPFCAVEGGYRFRFRLGAERAIARIEYHDAEGELLRTSVSGAARPWTFGTLARLVARHGWMTALVVLRIHWQALRLLAKRVPFHTKPQPPEAWVSK